MSAILCEKETTFQINWWLTEKFETKNPQNPLAPNPCITPFERETGILVSEDLNSQEKEA